MAVTNRKTGRKALASLFDTELTGAGNPVQTVYDHRPGSLKQESPVVVVASAGSTRPELGFGTRRNDNEFALVAYVYVIEADPGNSWTHAEVDDTVDDIEAAIAQVLADNRVTSDWDYVQYDPAQGTTVVYVTIDGTSYAVERIPILMRKADS